MYATSPHDSVPAMFQATAYLVLKTLVIQTVGIVAPAPAKRSRQHRTHLQNIKNHSQESTSVIPRSIPHKRGSFSVKGLDILEFVLAVWSVVSRDVWAVVDCESEAGFAGCIDDHWLVCEI